MGRAVCAVSVVRACCACGCARMQCVLCCAVPAVLCCATRAARVVLCRAVLCAQVGAGLGTASDGQQSDRLGRGALEHGPGVPERVGAAAPVPDRLRPVRLPRAQVLPLFNKARLRCTAGEQRAARGGYGGEAAAGAREAPAAAGRRGWRPPQRQSGFAPPPGEPRLPCRVCHAPSSRPMCFFRSRLASSAPFSSIS